MQQRDDTQSAFANILQSVNKYPENELEIRFHGRLTSIEEEKFISKVQPNVFYEMLHKFRKGFMKNTIECEVDSAS
jgi:hypothetical protein